MQIRLGSRAVTMDRAPTVGDAVQLIPLAKRLGALDPDALAPTVTFLARALKVDEAEMLELTMEQLGETLHDFSVWAMGSRPSPEKVAI